MWGFFYGVICGGVVGGEVDFRLAVLGAEWIVACCGGFGGFGGEEGNDFGERIGWGEMEDERCRMGDGEIVEVTGIMADDY